MLLNNSNMFRKINVQFGAPVDIIHLHKSVFVNERFEIIEVCKCRKSVSRSHYMKCVSYSVDQNNIYTVHLNVMHKAEHAIPNSYPNIIIWPNKRI